MTAQAWRGDPPQPPEVFAAQAAQALADATAEDIVQWAADTFDDRFDHCAKRLDIESQWRMRKRLAECTDCGDE